MWRPGCQLFLAFVRSHKTQTRKSRACISRSHGADDDADVADLRFFVSHFRDDPIALLDAAGPAREGVSA